MTTTAVRQTFQRLIPEVLKVIAMGSLNSKISYAAPTILAAFCIKLKAPHRGKFLGACVCGGGVGFLAVFIKDNASIRIEICNTIRITREPPVL
jgi:hypothetical protein